VTASWDTTLRLWTVPGGAELRTLRGHAGPVTAVAFSPDGARLVSGGEDRRVVVWPLMTRAAGCAFQVQPAVVSALAYAPAGSVFASAGGRDRTVRFWPALAAALPCDTAASSP